MPDTIYLLDFSLWKRLFLKYFFPGYKCIFTTSEAFLQKISSCPCDTEHPLTVAFWAANFSNETNGQIIRAQKTNPGLKVLLLEDAFIRSLGLGSDFFYPYSLVMDPEGIYYDPSKVSGFERLMQTLKEREDYEELKLRAEAIGQKVIDGCISKYFRIPKTTYQKKYLALRQHIKENEMQGEVFEKIIFIPAQVDDDASIRTGGCGYNNLKILQSVRQRYPGAYIILKIHPDVYAGNRNGGATIDDFARYADLIITNEYSSLECIAVAEEVHTISSLTGFEALIRGKKVICYGMPFYAGWGLTEDVAVAQGHSIAQAAQRRRSASGASLEDLMIVSYVLYPTYFNWSTLKAATPEEIIELFGRLDRTRQNQWCYWLSHLVILPFKRLTGSR